MNEQIINEVYQLAGGEVPREKITRIASSFSPDEMQKCVEGARQVATKKPEMGKNYVWWMFVEGCCLKRGILLLFDEAGKPLPDDEEKIEEALAAFREALPYLEYVLPQIQVLIYVTMIRAYLRKYKRPENFPGKGGSPEEQKEFVEVWNVFQKLEEIWPVYEGLGQPPAEIRKGYEDVMKLKPDYLFEALTRLERYKDIEEIYEMRESNPKGAIEEWKKWLPHRELVSVVLSPAVEFSICFVEFLAACEDAYGTTSNFPSEDLNYAWEAIQSARRIWNAHQQEVVELMKIPEAVLSQNLEQAYQQVKYEVLVRFEGYKPLDEIEGMLESNPKGAVEELKKWFPHKEFFSVAGGPAGEFYLHSYFLAACEGAYGALSNYPDEDFNYAWEAIQSARRIWNAHQQKVIELMEIPVSELRSSDKLLEQSYQTHASEYSRRRTSPGSQPQAQPSSGPCFIATAVYGAENAPEVLALRSFRDDILLSSKLGSALVNFYYLISPPVARLLRANSLLRDIVRKAVVCPIANMVCSKLYPN